MSSEEERPPCTACKQFRRTCTPGRVFAPYFPPGDDPDRFAAVHAVFRARHVADLVRELREIPLAQRKIAVNWLVSRAQALPARREVDAQQLNAALVAARGQVMRMSAPLVGAQQLDTATGQAARLSASEATSRQRRPPCAACKRLRRRCVPGDCVFAPYFPPGDDAARFAAVNAAYGASNVATLLKELPAEQRQDVVNSLVYEALAIREDPVYGCVGVIGILNTRLKQEQAQLAAALKELARYVGEEAASALVAVPAHETRAPETVEEMQAVAEAARLEMLRQCAADARAGTTNFVTPLHERIVKDMAREMAKGKQLAVPGEQEPAAHVHGRSSGVTVAIAPPAPAQAAPVIVLRPPPPPLQAQSSTAGSGVRDPGLPEAEDHGGDEAPQGFS